MSSKVLYTLILFLVSQISFSQRIQSRKKYIETYRELAIIEMQRTGVPASIKLAQACLESNNGNSLLSRKSNNHFGIKCKSNWTGKRTFHDDDSRNECFRAYRSVEESYIDHSNFLAANPRYSKLFRLKITDYKGWARGLKQAGYATNPHYAESLIRIIEENKLYRYDQLADIGQIGRFSSGRGSRVNGLVNPFLSQEVVLRNGLKTIVVKAGNSMVNLAKRFGLKTWELYHYNDYPYDYVPRENEILYLERKTRKTPRGKETHVLESGETMHYVSQVYGIKLNPLLRRNRMDKKEMPPAGTVIYLRHKRPR
ncbi:MAG: glycoside hydrolase family 73 protein [Mangrovibacterium sp.]